MADDAEVAAARDAYGSCVAAAVARMDDGRTDPFSLAVGIMPMCKPQYARLTNLMIYRNITERGQNEMRREMREGEVQLVTSAIVIHRSKSKPRA